MSSRHCAKRSFVFSAAATGAAAVSGAGPARQRLDAAQHGLIARYQLAQVEGLGDVVVGADLRADDLVDRASRTVTITRP